MPSKHIIEAIENGPKAGFRAYCTEAARGRGGLAHVLATQEAILTAGNAKAQFDAYCAKFGDQWNKPKASKRARKVEPEVSMRDRLAALARSAIGKEAAEMVDPAPAKRARKPRVTKIDAAPTFVVNGETRPLTNPDAPATFPQAMTLRKAGIRVAKGEVTKAQAATMIQAAIDKGILVNKGSKLVAA